MQEHRTHEAEARQAIAAGKNFYNEASLVRIPRRIAKAHVTRHAVDDVVGERQKWASMLCREMGGTNVFMVCADTEELSLWTGPGMFDGYADLLANFLATQV